MTHIAQSTQGKSFISRVDDPVERTLQSCVLRDPSLSLIVSEKSEYNHLEA
jgi:hypothetical protein